MALANPPMSLLRKMSTITWNRAISQTIHRKKIIIDQKTLSNG